MPTFVQILDFIGTFAFAISGIRLASAKRFDWFGAYVVGLATAIGGGTIRDVLLDVTPGWMTDPIYLICTGLALLWVICFGRWLIRLNNTFFIFDTIGLALFTVVGVGKSIALGYPFWVAIIMGSITGAAGGVIRDVFINEIPLIFRKEIYAMACVVGGIAYWICDLAGMESYACQLIGGSAVFLTRILAVKYHICLPILKGSDDISNFPVIETRMEGQNLKYFSALINVDKVDGFTLSGKGKVDGNGERYWKSFWLRRRVIPKCTNMDELRPRLLHISHSNNVQVSDVRLVNSPFWTTHIYKCDSVKLLNLHIFSPSFPVKAPSTDAIDIDACKNVLVKGCYMSVNDDAIALKGGKGPWADQDPDNGGNCDIIIEDCTFGFCHGVLTCGSESIYNHNIILRRCNLDQAKRLLWLKMRPDTPQQYKYILVEDIKGNVRNCIFIAPWTQFYDLKDRKDMPVSYSSYITMRNIHLDCDSFFAVEKSKQYKLSNFCFDNLTITAKKDVKIDEDIIDALVMRKVEINKVN